MRSYVLDTNVVSAFSPGRPGKPPPDPAVAVWVRRNEDSLFLSAITPLEIEAGLLKLGRTSPGRWHTQMAEWFAVFLEQFTHRVLPIDLSVARIAAAMTDRNVVRGLDPGLADILIAATTVANGMTLLTRNLRHFIACGVEVVDPFKALPE